MSTIDTISDLLAISNSQYRIYDIGRKVSKISKSQFSKIELNQIPYPYPFQNHAFIAVAFWQKQSTEPYIWFVKIPLDERGLLNQGARNHFIGIIVEALGSDLTVDPTTKQEELLNANPYHYTPAGYKLSSLNSLLKVELKLELSEHYQYFKQYMTGSLGWDNWHKVGLQGICDFAAQVTEKEHTLLLLDALPNIPKQVMLPLSIALENEALPVTLIEGIIDVINSTSIHQNNELYRHLLRSLASSCEHPYVTKLMSSLLNSEKINNETLITLSGRCWSVLKSTELMMMYLESLADTNDLNLFNAIFKDLVAIPELRPIIFQCMRSPQRSDKLAKAIGQLFN